MNFRTSAICKGCRHDFAVSFEQLPDWIQHKFLMDCPKCESKLEIQCKRAGNKFYIRTKMIKHTDKLLSLLKEV